MAGDQVLMGQEVAIRVIADGDLLAEISFFRGFNGSSDREIKQNDYLGEQTARFVEVQVGYSLDFEFDVNTSNWLSFENAMAAKATRANPALTFQVVNVERFSDGSNITHTYEDIAWGGTPTAVASRTDMVKVKASGKCSRRTSVQNAFV